jgi:hypothetical protein
MAVKVLSIALTGTAQQLSAGFAGSEGLNLPYRQLLFTATGAAATLGGPGVTPTTGVTLATTAPLPLSIGPFETGPVKLSDLYAVGAGATLTILGIPF